MTKKAIISIVLVIATIIIYFMGGTSVAYAADDEILFDQTYVLDDLEGSAVDGVPFDVADYPYDKNGDVEILGFAEYGYSAYSNMQDNYGLYIYLYNPALLDISVSSCQIQIGIGDSASSADTYNKYYLQVVSRSEGTEQNRFLKMKVLGAENFVDELDPAARRYFVSGIEIMCYGSSDIKEYVIDTQFTYSGFSKGYSEESIEESTLQISATEIGVKRIEGLSERQTVYRDNLGNPSVTAHNQVNGVYFSLEPEYFVNDYWLQTIKAEWYEYRTNPILVVDNQEYYDKLYALRGANISSYDPSLGVGFSVGETETTFVLNLITGPVTGTNHVYDYSYNVFLGTSENELHRYGSNKIYTRWGWVLKGDGDIMDTYNVPSSLLYSYRDSYEDQFVSTLVTDGTVTYSSDLFNTNVGQGRTAGYNLKLFDAENDAFDFTDYGIDTSTYGGWQKFKAFFGWTPETESVLEDQSPFLIIDRENYGELFAGDDKAAIARRLLIDESEVDSFKQYCDTELLKGNKVVHFRFACTEYNAQYASMRYTTDCNGFVAEENVFLNFDVLEIGFSNENGEYRVIPVVNDPIDIISGIIGPTPQPDLADEAKIWWDEFVEAMKAFFASIFGTAEDWKKFLYIVLGVVAAIVVIWIIVKVVGLFGGSKKSETVIKIDPSMYREQNKKGK